MTGSRNYIEKRNLFDVLTDLQKNKGTQFDPKLVDYFILGVINNQYEHQNIEEQEEVRKCL